jgi:HK97 family phage portal protein
MWRRLGTWARRSLSAFRAQLYSVSDPALAAILGFGSNVAGVGVGEGSVIGLSAVYRAVSLISGTLAQLPMRTLRDTGDGMRQRINSFLDNPGGPNGPTAFEWKETCLWHLLLHGNAFAAHVFGGAGQLVALALLHPLCVTVELPGPDDTEQPAGGKWFYATLLDGTRRRFDATTMTHIMGPSLDGVRGLSVISVARNSLGTAIAGDQAAAKMFGSGLTVSGMVTPDEDSPDWEDSKEIKESVNAALTGIDNAGQIAVLNRKLKFTKMSMSAEDAQFLQSRQFSIEEIARWFGVPPFELMQTDKQTSWGTGIEAQQRGLGRTVLAPWATRIEQRLSRLLPNPRFVEFDFHGLERPDPATEIGLLLQETDGGLLTLNEARAILNLPPVEGGDVLRLHGQPITGGTQATPAEQAATDPVEEVVPSAV